MYRLLCVVVMLLISVQLLANHATVKGNYWADQCVYVEKDLLKLEAEQTRTSCYKRLHQAELKVDAGIAYLLKDQHEASRSYLIQASAQLAEATRRHCHHWEAIDYEYTRLINIIMVMP